MLSRSFWQGILAVAVAAALAAHGSAAQVKRYNIISIVTDDQSQWSVGAYGNKEARTPNMDRLAKEGAIFRNAFVATPVCSPSRVSFLTGKYGTQVGITDWIAPAESDAGLGIPASALTWPMILKKHGYVTALVGKWHLGTLPQFHPTKHGFDHFFGFLGGGNTPMNPTLEENGKQRKFKGPLPDILTDDAMEFIKNNKGRPFALLLHFRAPHLPYGPVPAEDMVPFKNLDPTVPKSPGMDLAQVKTWTRDYYASIHSVDRNIGRLLKLLDDLGLAQNTIVLLTSDHGYMIGHHGLHMKGNGHWIAGGVFGPKRPNMYDLAISVPLLIRWPGQVKPGTEIKELVSNIDTFASVLGMLKVPLPGDYKQEGMDFSPLLRGEKVSWRDAVFSQYDLHNGGLAFMRGIRTSRWHLVRHHLANFMDELYDLETDPGETKNLYAQPGHREIRDQLLARLAQWQQGISDPILKFGK